MRKILFFTLITIMLFACSANIISHDENKAVLDANKTLKTLYFEQNYKKAHNSFAPELQKLITIPNLEQIHNQLEVGIGKLKELQVDSFLPMPGQKAITVFYKGIHDRGISYHRIVLFGDAKGYKIGGLFVSDRPYPEHKLRQKFVEPVVIK